MVFCLKIWGWKKNPKQIYQTLFTSWQLRHWLGLVFAGALGCWPLLLYNIQTGGTWQTIFANAGTSYYGVDNANVLQNLLTRLGQVGFLLTSSHFWYLGEIHHNYIALIGFIIFLGIALHLSWRYRILTPLIPFLIIFGVVLQSIVTVSDLWVTHFALLMVWPTIAMVTVYKQQAVRIVPNLLHALGSTVRGQKQQLTWGNLAYLFLPFLVVWGIFFSDLLTTVQYHQALSVSGGLSDHSDAVYDMALVVGYKCSWPSSGYGLGPLCPSYLFNSRPSYPSRSLWLCLGGYRPISNLDTPLFGPICPNLIFMACA